MRGFFGMPTLGGKLTILNCLLWAIVLLGCVTESSLLMFPAFVACWPLAWLFILPALGSTRRGDDWTIAFVMIGVNSLLWGYGIAWLVSLFTRRKPSRGFDVIIHSNLVEPSPAAPAASRQDSSSGRIRGHH